MFHPHTSSYSLPIVAFLLTAVNIYCCMSLAVLSSLLSLLLLIQPSTQQNEYMVVKRFPYMNWAVVRTLNDPRAVQAMHIDREDRYKRAPWDLLENTDSKRTSLKRLAILSARGFGR